MANIHKACAFGVLVLAGLSAGAMPVGVRLAMQGRMSSIQTAPGSAFPELDSGASAIEVAAALDGATDDALAENISDAEAYSQFRAWASSVGAANVKASNTAWMSYALGATTVLPLPKEGDLAIDDIALGDDGKLEAVVSLDGVYVNSAALEARLKTIFGVEGATTLDESAFSSDNVGLSLEPTGDGRVRAVVTPPPDVDKSYFMRMKVK